MGILLQQEIQSKPKEINNKHPSDYMHPMPEIYKI